MRRLAEDHRLEIGKGIRVISFFTGAGGLDLGFDLAGFDVIYATDIEEICCKTLKANQGGLLSANTVIEQADIRQIKPTELPPAVDLVIGGPPCQSFSASGRRAGGVPGRLDARGTLFEAYCRIIDAVQPKAFLFENVRGILGTNKGEDWRAIVAAFREIGYRISYRILDALDYGVPQQRERMIMVGHKLAHEFLFPRPLFGPDAKEQQPYVTAGEALANITNDPENKTDLVLRNGKYAHLLPLVPPGDNYLFFTAKRGHATPVFAYRSRFSDFLYKAKPTAPVKTLIARPGKYTGPFHWENRYFTAREYMRLQGFPDEYQFVGDREQIIRQIGNSVSPKLAFHLAAAIAQQIFARAVDVELMPSHFHLSFDRRKSQKAAKTRSLHSNVALQANGNPGQTFTLVSYAATVSPSDTKKGEKNVFVETNEKIVELVVQADDSGQPFARMKILLYRNEEALAKEIYQPDVTLDVTALGSAPHTVQTMWNAVDDWVIRSSNFHSLFELYGHFTEPHPVFRIAEFDTLAATPIAAFAKHVACFANCSRYFPREHLTNLFSGQFGVSDFLELVKMLRSYRFDIRCNETNIAIPPDVYMVAYPFTLPFGKQMNFSIKPQRLAEKKTFPQNQAAQITFDFLSEYQ